MKTITLSFALLMSLSTQATTINEIFGPLANGAGCFGKTYSAAHLKSHPKQTVKNILVKLSNKKDQYSSDGRTYLLEVMVNQKSAPSKALRQAMVCFEAEGKVVCPVDCDGGSMNIEALEEGMLTLKNNGLIVKGGCGEEEAETVYLENKRGGDDLFVLNELPLAACKAVPFPNR